MNIKLRGRVAKLMDRLRPKPPGLPPTYDMLPGEVWQDAEQRYLAEYGALPNAIVFGMAEMTPAEWEATYGDRPDVDDLNEATRPKPPGAGHVALKVGQVLDRLPIPEADEHATHLEALQDETADLASALTELRTGEKLSAPK